MFAVLDIAADYKRDRAGACADCPDQSCLACQARLQDARTYDQMAGRLLQTAEATRAAARQPARARRPARRQASDHPAQDTGRTANRPPGRFALSPARAKARRTYPKRQNPMTRRSPADGHQDARST